MTRLLLTGMFVVASACGGDDASSADDGASGAEADSGSPSPETGNTSASTDGSTTDGDSSSVSDGGSDDGASGPIECRAKGDGKSTITFINRCDGALFFRGSGIDGGELAPGQHACRDLGDTVETISAIRYWGYVGVDPGPERHTLAELTLNTDFHDFDWYNISHVDAHNLPMQIIPVGMDDCRTLTCPESLLEGCPPEGRFLVDGEIVSCVSPDRDNPESPVAQYFDAACADAYSWSGDDEESMAACAGEDYDVVFCP